MLFKKLNMYKRLKRQRLFIAWTRQYYNNYFTRIYEINLCKRVFKCLNYNIIEKRAKTTQLNAKISIYKLRYIKVWFRMWLYQLIAKKKCQKIVYDALKLFYFTKKKIRNKKIYIIKNRVGKSFDKWIKYYRLKKYHYIIQKKHNKLLKNIYLTKLTKYCNNKIAFSTILMHQNQLIKHKWFTKFWKISLLLRKLTIFKNYKFIVSKAKSFLRWKNLLYEKRAKINALILTGKVYNRLMKKDILELLMTNKKQFLLNKKKSLVYLKIIFKYFVKYHNSYIKTIAYYKILEKKFWFRRLKKTTIMVRKISINYSTYLRHNYETKRKEIAIKGFKINVTLNKEKCLKFNEKMKALIIFRLNNGFLQIQAQYKIHTLNIGFVKLNKLINQKNKNTINQICVYLDYLKQRNDKLMKIRESRLFCKYSMKMLSNNVRISIQNESITLFYASKLLKKSFFSLTLHAKEEKLNLFKIAYIQLKGSFLYLKQEINHYRTHKKGLNLLINLYTNKEYIIYSKAWKLVKMKYLISKHERYVMRCAFKQFLRVFIQMKVLEKLDYKINRRIAQKVLFKIQMYSYLQ